MRICRQFNALSLPLGFYTYSGDSHDLISGDSQIREEGGRCCVTDRKHSHRAFSSSHCCNFVSCISDDLHRKSEKDMTEEELKQKDIDRAYFHSHRDTNKDGVMDKVKKIINF